MTRPPTSAATKIPLPVADNQLKVKIAASGLVGLPGVGVGTTGGVRTTTLCRPGTGKSILVAPCCTRISPRIDLVTYSPFKKFFACGIPQTKTKTLSNTHGVQARTT